MIKKLILLSAMLFLSKPIFAEEKFIPIEIHKEKDNSGNKQWERSPMNIPIVIIYDTNSHIVLVEGYDNIEATVFLYDEFGNILDSSSTINTEFMLHDGCVYSIVIQGCGWEGEAIIKF